MIYELIYEIMITKLVLKKLDELDFVSSSDILRA